MSGGGVIVARSLWDDPIFQDDPFSEREAWIWMICEAAWKPRQKRIGKVIVNLERGQLAASIRFMAEAFSWHRNKVNRFLKRLEKCTSIRAESGTGVNVITICKYDEYQLSPKSNGTAAGQQRDSSGTNENKGNKVKDNTNVLFKKPTNRATAIRDDWSLSERSRQDAIDRQFSAEEINHEANQFRDYHLAKGSTYKNWDAAWRTWLGNSRKFARGPANQSGRKNRGDIIADAVHQAGLRGFD